MTVASQRDRYKQALEDIAEYCPYAMARDMAKHALDLEQPLRRQVPRTSLVVKEQKDE